VSSFQWVWRYSCLKLVRADPMEKVPLAKRKRMVFQHDSVPAHYSRLVAHHTNVTFPERWIGRRGHVQWPLRSTDLTPLYFFLWGWINSEVYEEKVNTRDKLVPQIMNSAALLKQERQDNLRRATRTIIKSMVGFFKHLLWTTAITEIIYITKKCNQ
jgi:hypothetical protein